jgi:hypothetical protein
VGFNTDTDESAHGRGRAQPVDLSAMASRRKECAHIVRVLDQECDVAGRAQCHENDRSRRTGEDDVVESERLRTSCSSHLIVIRGNEDAPTRGDDRGAA